MRELADTARAPAAPWEAPTRGGKTAGQVWLMNGGRAAPVAGLARECSRNTAEVQKLEGRRQQAAATAEEGVKMAGAFQTVALPGSAPIGGCLAYKVSGLTSQEQDASQGEARGWLRRGLGGSSGAPLLVAPVVLLETL